MSGILNVSRIILMSGPKAPNKVYTLVVQVGRREGDGLPDGATGAALLASAIIYVPGLVWPALAFGTEWASLWAHWMAPFIAGDVLKSVIAALAVSGGLAWLGRR